MEHISLTTIKNKKGVSLSELIAYVALYGVVMSLLASLVFVIVKAARKVNSQSILNRGATTMYTEILSQTIMLDPDTVSEVSYYSSATMTESTKIANPASDKGSIVAISITFTKRFAYAKRDGEPTGKKEGERYELANPQSITYVFYKKDTPNVDFDNIEVIRNNDKEHSSSINLEYKMYISSSAADDNIYNCIQVSPQTKTSKFVTFNGYLHFDNKYQEFNFIIPVFIASDEETTP